MAIRIEEAFNDCFERLSFGESLDSCLRSYPEHAMELDLMLRMAFDVKRRAHPIQPRPEFKYWSRVRLQGVQDYMSKQTTEEKAGPFNFRRNLAISVAGLLVFIIASSGTVAASNDALPDQPLYGVKTAVEQAQLAMAVSDVDKAVAYANLAGKRALEIETMARQGKTEYLITTSTRMDYQLEQAEIYISKYQAATSAGSPAMTTALPTDTSSTEGYDQTVQPAPAATTEIKPPYASPDNKTGAGQTTVKRPVLTAPAAANVNKAKTALSSSSARSLATLQDALDKAPESAKPAIIKAIERMKKANEWSQQNLNQGQQQDNKPGDFIPKPENFPVKPLPDVQKPKRDGNDNFVTPDKPRYIPPLDKDLTKPVTDTVKPPVTLPDVQLQVPANTVIPGTSDSGPTQTQVITNTTGTVNSDSSITNKTQVITNTINTVTSPTTRQDSGDATTTK